MKIIILLLSLGLTAIVISFAFASHGEPQSLWLWQKAGFLPPPAKFKIYGTYSGVLDDTVLSREAATSVIPNNTIGVTRYYDKSIEVGGAPMVALSKDGKTNIDWARVEAYAKDGSDVLTKGWCQALLAVRDKTWEPLPLP